MDRDKERQQALYNMLLANGDKWITMHDIYTKMYVFYPPWMFSNFHDSAGRRLITSDIQKINNDGSYDKMIIRSNRGVKIANDQEAEEFLSKQYVSAYGRLKRLGILKRKAGSNGQIAMTGDGLKEIEAFLEAQNG